MANNYKEYKKQWNVDHKEDIRLYNKSRCAQGYFAAYYHKHLHTSVVCDCGREVTKGNLLKHKKRRIHTELMAAKCGVILLQSDENDEIGANNLQLNASN